MMHGAVGRRGDGVFVSILVVLDWTMMPSPRSTKPPARCGFNPCCIGLDNDAADGNTYPTVVIGVSILVVLDWTMMLGHLVSARVPHILFQSLLYWIGQ